ncbi:MAG: hypothetical protein GY838_16095 [bacterium]|nr:hypothetical protein [bacterium]
MTMGNFKGMRNVAIIALLLCPTVSAAAGFAKVGYLYFATEGVFTDARNAAMGGADLVGNGNPQQVLINPAPLLVDGTATMSYDRMNFMSNYDLEDFAAGAALGPLQVAVARTEYRIKSVRRTAYNPVGTRYEETLTRMSVVGLGLRGGWEDGFRWAGGLAYRKYEAADASDRDGLDAGVSAGLTQRHDTGWMSLAGAVSWQNIFGASLPRGDWELLPPEPVRLGLTAGLGLRPRDWRRDAAQVRFAVTRTVRREHDTDDESQWGVEITALQILSLRWGMDSRLLRNTTMWGLGLRLDEEFTGPFSAEVHWTVADYDNDQMYGDNDYTEGWGVRVAYDF